VRFQDEVVSPGAVETPLAGRAHGSAEVCDHVEGMVAVDGGLAQL
jgi:hypothetical protein